MLPLRKHLVKYWPWWVMFTFIVNMAGNVPFSWRNVFLGCVHASQFAWLYGLSVSLLRFVKASRRHAVQVRRHAASVRRAEAGSQAWKEMTDRHKTEDEARHAELLKLAMRLDEKVTAYNKLVGVWPSKNTATGSN